MKVSSAPGLGTLTPLATERRATLASQPSRQHVDDPITFSSAARARADAAAHPRWGAFSVRLHAEPDLADHRMTCSGSVSSRHQKDASRSNHGLFRSRLVPSHTIETDTGGQQWKFSERAAPAASSPSQSELDRASLLSARLIPASLTTSRYRQKPELAQRPPATRGSGRFRSWRISTPASPKRWPMRTRIWMTDQCTI